MPEFLLNHGSTAARRAYSDLDCFTQGCIQALFFTETGPDDEGLEDATVADLDQAALDLIIADCADFQESHHYHLLDAIEWAERAGKSYSLERAGMDFLYTRNHHGVGYWDRGLGPHGDRLTKIAHRYKAVSLYRGDDRRIHLA